MPYSHSLHFFMFMVSRREQRSAAVLLPSGFKRPDTHMNYISGLFVNGRLNIFAHSKDVTDRSILIFNTHIDDAASVENTVKFGFHFQTALTGLLTKIPWKAHLRAALIGDLLNFRVKLPEFFHLSLLLLFLLIQKGAVCIVHHSRAFHSLKLSVFDRKQTGYA